MSILIGIGGRWASGKDALADFLVEQHGFEKTFPSETLNEALLTVDPLIPLAADWTLPEFHDWCEQVGWPGTSFARYVDLHEQVGYVEAKRIPEVRRLLQALGTDVGRNMLGPETWIKPLEERIERWRSHQLPAVVTGIRYPNEMEMIRRHGGHLVWVERPVAAEEVLAALDAAIEHEQPEQRMAAHSSETSLHAGDFEIIVVNDGTLLDLRRKADELIDGLS